MGPARAGRPRSPSGQKSRKPAGPQTTRRLVGPPRRQRGGHPAGTIAARRVAPIAVGIGPQRVVELAHQVRPSAASVVAQPGDGPAGSSAASSAYGWPGGAAQVDRRPRATCRRIGQRPESIPPRRPVGRAWPGRQDWTRAPASARRIAAASPARPRRRRATSARAIGRLRGLVANASMRVEAQDAPVDPARQPQLLELAAPGDRPGAPVALAQEVATRCSRLGRRPPRRARCRPARRSRRPRGTCRTRPGRDPCPAGVPRRTSSRLQASARSRKPLEHRPGHELALADQGGVAAAGRLVRRQPVAQPVVARSRPWPGRTSSAVVHGALDAELGARPRRPSARPSAGRW